MRATIVQTSLHYAHRRVTVRLKAAPSRRIMGKPPEKPMFNASWIAQANQHWKEHQPTTYKRLKAEGTLQTRLREAAEATQHEMDVLMNEGFDHEQAWEMVRERYLFPPEEAGLDEPMEPNETYSAMAGFNRAIQDFYNPED